MLVHLGCINVTLCYVRHRHHALVEAHPAQDDWFVMDHTKQARASREARR